MFVCLCLHFAMLMKHIYAPVSSDKDDKEGQQDLYIKFIYTCYMLVFNIARCFMCMPYRNNDRTFSKISNTAWITLLVLETIGACMIFFFKKVKGSNTFSSCLVDSIVMLGMLL